MSNALLIAVACVAAPAAIAIAYKTKKALPKIDLCHNCSYSLKGLATPCTCPECGSLTDGSISRKYRVRDVVYCMAIMVISPAIGAAAAIVPYAMWLPPVDLWRVMCIAAAPYVLVSLSAAAFCRVANFHVLLSIIVFITVWSAFLMMFVATMYWHAPSSPSDSGWPLTNVILLSIVQGCVFALGFFVCLCTKVVLWRLR